MNRIRSIIIARGASNPGIRLSSSGIGVVTGDTAGVNAGDTVGEGVTAGVRVAIKIKTTTVAHFSVLINSLMSSSGVDTLTK